MTKLIEIPAALLTHRVAQDGFAYDSVEWYEVLALLDSHHPHWCHSVNVFHTALASGSVLVGATATLTALIAGNMVSRAGYSGSIIRDPTQFEMIAKATEQDALKRAAVKLGIGRELLGRKRQREDADAGPYTEAIHGTK